MSLTKLLRVAFAALGLLAIASPAANAGGISPVALNALTLNAGSTGILGVQLAAKRPSTATAGNMRMPDPMLD